MFNEGRENFHDEGRPLLATEELKEQITNVIGETDIGILQLFAKLKYSLGGSRFKSDDEVKEPLHTGCPNICFP